MGVEGGTGEGRTTFYANHFINNLTADGKIDLEKVQFINTAEVRLQ